MAVKVKVKDLAIHSPAFENNQLIPSKYTCDGENVNPPFIIEGLPKETVSLAIIADDPDANDWLHWMVWDIPPVKEITENFKKGIKGLNDFHRHGYGGPCPPGGTHHYYFTFFALDSKLELPNIVSRKDMENVMGPRIIGIGQYTGLYHKDLSY